VNRSFTLDAADLRADVAGATLMPNNQVHTLHDHTILVRIPTDPPPGSVDLVAIYHLVHCAPQLPALPAGSRGIAPSNDLDSIALLNPFHVLLPGR
jgi:hypothetical protein